jgi:hypothetical protein
MIPRGSPKMRLITEFVPIARGVELDARRTGVIVAFAVHQYSPANMIVALWQSCPDAGHHIRHLSNERSRVRDPPKWECRNGATASPRKTAIVVKLRRCITLAWTCSGPQQADVAATRLHHE